MADGGGSSTGISELELSEMHRQYKVEKFYYDEAAMLDSRNYEDWLTIFTPDTHYFMPIRRTMTSNELDQEFTKPGDLALFDDDFDMLSARVRKLATGYSWAEDPPSRQRHIVSNVRILSDDGHEMDVESNFHFYRTRLNSEEDTWIGSRRDRIKRTEDGFKIAKREIFLEQTVLLARNLSNFF